MVVILTMKSLTKILYHINYQYFINLVLFLELFEQAKTGQGSLKG